MATDFGYKTQGIQYDYVHPDLLRKARKWAQKEFDDMGLEGYLLFKKERASANTSLKNHDKVDHVQVWPVPPNPRALPQSEKKKKPTKGKRKSPDEAGRDLSDEDLLVSELSDYNLEGSDGD